MPTKFFGHRPPPNAFSGPFQETRGLGPGPSFGDLGWMWTDLASAKALAYALAQVGGTAIGDLIGPRTGCPIGFTVPQIMQLFYGVKKFTLAVSYPGMEGGDTSLGYHFTSYVAPPGMDRAKLLSRFHGHFYLPESFSPAFFCYPFGFIYEGLFYPNLSFSGSWSDEEEESSGVVSTIAEDGDEEAGTLTVFGQTAPIYDTASDAPSGSAAATVAETWTP